MLGTWSRGILELLGEWDVVLAEEEAVESPDDRFLLWERLLSSLIFLRRGEREEARRRVEAARDTLDPRELQIVAGFRSMEAELFLAEGRPREALAAAGEAIAVRADLAGGLSAIAQGFGAALEAAFALGDEAKVDDLLALVERLPPGELTPHLRAVGARFSARRATLHGDNGTAAAGFLAAARILRDIEMPFVLAVVLLEHAEWLAGEGRLEGVEPLIDEARETFERLRATPYLERLERLPVATTAAG